MGSNRRISECRYYNKRLRVFSKDPPKASVSTVTDMFFFAEPDGASAGAVRAHMMEGEHGNEDPPAFPDSYPEPTSTLKVNGDTP